VTEARYDRRVTEAIERAYSAGMTAWPEIVLDREVFARHVTAVGAAALEEFGRDLYLAAACSTGEAGALAVFERDCGPAARHAIQAIDRDDAFVAETLQTIRAHLFVGSEPRIRQYMGRGPLAGWVSVAATRAALMLRRSRLRLREDSVDDWTRAMSTLATNDPELELLKRQYADAFATALRDAVASIEPRAMRVLRLGFVEHLSIDEIGRVYGVHRATAARWIQRACEDVFERLRGLLAERLALSHTEIERMNALVRSQLEVSLSQLLPPRDP
jgi:RNA polymerase sigma-70 factor, ECF subfamily